MDNDQIYAAAKQAGLLGTMPGTNKWEHALFACVRSLTAPLDTEIVRLTQELAAKNANIAGLKSVISQVHEHGVELPQALWDAIQAPS